MLIIYWRGTTRILFCYQTDGPITYNQGGGGVNKWGRGACNWNFTVGGHKLKIASHGCCTLVIFKL